MSETLDRKRKAQYESYLKAELGAAAQYQAMSQIEKDPKRAEVFQRLVDAEMRHASRWADKLGIDPATIRPAQPDVKLNLYRLVARVFGTNRVIPFLLRGEAEDIATYAADPEAHDFVPDEQSHGRILRELTSGDSIMSSLRREPGHSIGGGGSLRAAVLGVNDGLVSNFSLVMGIAGGTGNPSFVLLAGVAGLLAGAFSMAAGEYISMRSQRDLYEHQIQIERQEILEFPEEEEEELALIYEAKGLPREDAERIAKYIMARPSIALETMAREELGLDPEELGSPWGAAGSSFVAFVAGAIVPILPYIFDAGTLALGLSVGLSALALIFVGGSLSLFTGKNIVWGALRMLFAGGIAAGVTFVVGKLIGVSVAG